MKRFKRASHPWSPASCASASATTASALPKNPTTPPRRFSGRTQNPFRPPSQGCLPLREYARGWCLFFSLAALFYFQQVDGDRCSGALQRRKFCTLCGARKLTKAPRGARQHPTWGGVSPLLPMPAGMALRALQGAPPIATIPPLTLRPLGDSSPETRFLNPAKKRFQTTCESRARGTPSPLPL
jgi:hypothetical protein